MSGLELGLSIMAVMCFGGVVCFLIWHSINLGGYVETMKRTKWLLIALGVVSCALLVCLVGNCTFGEARSQEIRGHIYIDGNEIYGGAGEPIVLSNNIYATNPTFSELITFIANDTTNLHLYIEGGPSAYIHSDFARDVHNNAEGIGIRSAWVRIKFVNTFREHSCNAFETTDKGLVYLDCTGRAPKVIWIDGSYETETSFNNTTFTEGDSIAHIEVGEEYKLIGIGYETHKHYRIHNTPLITESIRIVWY